MTDQDLADQENSEPVATRREEEEEEESPKEGRTKTDASTKADMDAKAKEKIRIYKEQREAKRAKIEHQDRETQKMIDRQAFGHKPQVPETEGEPTNRGKEQNKQN